ncbi:methyl-accepting chemotaxis protein [Vibrio quintilis]|uniref:methyl-accepting chemotaxis protein n=1 Tax=Vibrio quintilis TaxID=1117707 RepID=UPI00135662A1|nr:methyl-accepting chemotaxis protein [Vibrio quintilis]
MFIAVLSWQGLRGLHTVAEQFEHLSERSLPLAITNAELVQSILESTKLLSTGVRVEDLPELKNLMSDVGIKTNQTHVELENLRKFADPQNGIPALTGEHISRLSDELDKLKHLSQSIMSLQHQRLAERAALDEVADSFRYGVSSLGPEMSRIANMFAFENPEAMDAANRFISNASRMESLFLMLMMEKKEKKAYKLYKELRTRQAGISLAFDDFTEWYPDVLEFASLTAPYEMVQKGFGKQGILKKLLAELELVNKQKSELNQALSLATLVIEQLDSISESAGKQIEQKKDLVSRTIDLTTHSQLVFAVVIMAIMMIVWLTLRRWICAALEHIIERLHALAAKDFSGSLVESGPSELRVVAKSLNEVVDSIRASLNQVTETSSALYQSSESSHQASESSHKRLEHQNQALTSMSSTMTEIEASIREIAAITQETHKESQTSVTHALAGVDVLNQSQETLKLLNSTLDTNDSAMNELVERVEQIHSMVDLISGIAESTNLLALNAAIEAARAGEAGRGFAVVADEVRNLASGTSQQTENIRGQMNELVDSVTRSRTAVQNSRTQMTSVLKSGEEVKHTFTDIEKIVKGISDRVEQISVAAEQQEEATTDVNRSINLISEQSSETAQSLHEVVDSAGQVSDIANRQQEMLTLYKL